MAAGADAYTPDSKWYLDGPWADFGYIYIPRNRRAAAQFSVWLRDEEAEPGKWGNPQTNMVIKRNGEVLSFWPGLNEANPLQLKPWYIRYDLNPRSKKGSVPASEYVEDGSYEITITLDGKVHGVYKYEMKGGKFAHTGAQVRDKTDPQLFIEGGGERFFIKRQ